MLRRSFYYYGQVTLLPWLTRNSVSIMRRSIVVQSRDLENALIPDRPSTLTAKLTDTERDHHQRRQLLYRSRQRGWLELDLIMGSWAQQHIDGLSRDELVEYAEIVRQENPDLIKYIVERVPPPEYINTAVMKRIIEYAHGAGKQWIVKKGNQT